VATVRGMNKTIPKVLINDLSYPLGKLVGFLFIVAVGGTMLDFAYIYVLGYGLAAVTGVFFIKQVVNSVSVKSLKIKKLASYSFPLALSGLTYKILTDIDTILLSYYSVTSDPVGIYNVVYPLAAVLLIIPQSTGYLTMPILSQLHSNNDMMEFRETYQMVMKWTTVASIPVVGIFILFPDLVLIVIYGAEYRAGSTALMLLVLGFFTHIFVGPNADSLEALGRARLLLIDGILVAVTNIGLNIILIPMFSIGGAALATALSYLLRNVVIGIQLYKISNIVCIPRQATLPAIYAVCCILLFRFFNISVSNPSQILFTALFLTGTGICYIIIILRTAAGRPELKIIDEIEEQYSIDMTIVRKLIPDQD
jgi:O-antigen/teichoic acid export membrane protein